MAIFESLSPQMLNLLWERETAEAQIVPLFRRTPLVQFDEMQNRFFVHTILQEFLKRILESEAESTRKEIYQNSGRLYMKMNRQDLAIGCFYAVSDYESILKTNLELLEFSDFQGVGFYEIAGEILENCPPSIKKKYPLSLLKLAYYSYNSMLMDQYDLLMKEAHEVIWEEDEMHNRGEWHLMADFYHFPDLDLIEKDYEEAARFLDGPSRIFTKKFPYLFGCASLWGMFYNKIGQGEEIGEKLTQVLDQYNRLTNGHAAGADVLFKGEHASMQCRYSEARMYAYEAMYLAEQHQNVTVAYGSALLLGRVGFATIGLAGLDEAISYLETRASTFPFMQQSETNHTMLAIVRCLLFTMLNQESEALEKTNFLLNKQSRPSFATWFVSYRKGKLLMAALEFEHALGYLKSLYQQESPIHSPGVSMILLIGMSFCYMALSKFEFATEAMEQAIAIAKPDKLVITFVQFRAYLKPLLMQPQLLEEHGEFIESIFSQEVTFATDPEEVYVAIQKSSLPANLTNRESEVAELVAQGLQNKEIASRLYISQSTVKNHLQSIYTKLDIDRRSQLTNLLR